MEKRHGDRVQDWSGADPSKQKKRWRVKLWFRFWFLRVLLTWPYNLLTYPLLAALLATVFWGLENKHRLEQDFDRYSIAFKSRVRLNTVAKLLSQHCDAHGRPPEDLRDFLEREFSVLDGIQPYQDFWGTEFSLETGPGFVVVRSAGPDRDILTPDDLIRRVEFTR